MASQADNEHVQARGKEAKRRLAAPKQIGFLGASTRQSWSGFIDAFEKQLELLGWISGPEFRIRDFYAQGIKENYRTHATNLARDADIVVTAGTEPLKALIATATTKPIVVASAGFAGSVPNNVSGFRNGQVANGPERFRKFRDNVGADLTRMAIMANANAENAAAERDAVRAEAGEVSPDLLNIADGAIGSQIAAQISGLAPDFKSLYVCTDPLLTMHRSSINNAANLKRLPTMYQFREHVEAGGLMSYGPDFARLFRDAATLVSRYLNGKQLPPIADADSSQFELVWNRSTAQGLDLHTGTGNIPLGFTGVITG